MAWIYFDSASFTRAFAETAATRLRTLRLGKRAGASSAARVQGMSDTAQTRDSDRVLTLPNIITVVRLLLVAPIMVLLIRDEQPVLMVTLLFIFGASDWVDGFIARRFNQTSRVGELLDPIADRLGVALIALAFVLAGLVPWWIPAVIAATDLSLGVLHLTRPGFQPPRVSWMGKVRTAVIMLAFFLVALGHIPGLETVGTVGLVMVFIGTALHVVAALGYARVILARSEPGAGVPRR